MANVGQKRSALFAFPARTICASFFLVIMTGTLLLMLPFSAKDGQFTSFMDALFTATSATCVTGLVVVDTFLHWSIFGQVVILCLIQIGGLGLVTFVTFFNILIGRKLGFRSRQLAQESAGADVTDIRSLIETIVGISLLVELIGALVLCLSFVPIYGRDGFFISVFLAVSAFCNAGFDILGREGAYASLTNYNSAPGVLIPIALLIIIGGLGFIVWHDLIHFRKNHRLLLHTRIVLIITAVLIVVGMAAYLILEWDNPATFGDLSVGEKLNAAFFQSVTTRTAGFNSVDYAAMTPIAKTVSMVLMFIGAAPGSTGGGIKGTTLVVIVMAIACVVRGEDETIIMKRRVPHQTVSKSLAIIMLGLLAVLISAGVIFFTEHKNGQMVSGIDAMFESVSAFGTVGLSVGVSNIANTISRLVLVLTMFIGRVGPVSLILSLAMRANRKDRQAILPEGKIMVG